MSATRIKDIWNPEYVSTESDSPIDPADESTGSLAEFYRDQAATIWPKGTVLYCPKCQRRQTAAVKDCAKFLAGGWPDCHGERMRIGDPPSN